MTRRQRNISGVAAQRLTPPLKNYDCKNWLENFSPWFFEIKAAFSSLIIFQRAKLSTRSITHLCWCNWRTLWRKTSAVISPMCSCSCTTMPRITGHFQPRRNWPTWAASVLITHPVLRICPCRTTICSLDWKSNWIVAIFCLMRRSLLPQGPGLTDKFPIFFLNGLHKLEQRSKNWIELRGGMLNKSRVGHCSIFSSLVGLRTYQHPLVPCSIIPSNKTIQFQLTWKQTWKYWCSVRKFMHSTAKCSSLQLSQLKFQYV